MTNQATNLDSWLKLTEDTWQNPLSFKIDKSKLKHLSIICDGNRRAAKKLNLNPYFGHRVGIETIKGIARTARLWGIDTLTFWVWSTENWGREKRQVEFVMNLAEKFLSEKSLLTELQEDKVRFTHIGRKDRLPKALKNILESLEENTSEFKDFRMNLALDYGGEDEIKRAVDRMLQERAKPDAIFDYLDTAGQLFPDLVIRSGVDAQELIHTSGFMPLQTAYSSWIFLPDLFPNITPGILLKTIQTFTEYQRRMGK